MNNQEIYDGMHWPVDTYADGLAYVKRFLGRDGTTVSTEIGNGTAVFDHGTYSAEKFMVSGGGPSAWIWFIFDEEGDIHHAYMEYNDGHGALLNIPFHLREALLRALRTDVANGFER